MKRAIALILLAATGGLLAACAHGPAGTEPNRVRVWRDAWGIPHVFANSIEDAYWGEGYVETQDRPAQMERMRRSARGRMAEMYGKDSLDSDKKRLARGYTDAELAAMWAACDPDTRRIVEAYCAGANAGFADRRKTGTLPKIFAETGIDPAPWTPIDCVAIGVMMSRRFGESGEVERNLSRAHDLLFAAYPEEKAAGIFEDLLRLNDPAAPTTLGDQLPTKILGPQSRLDASFDRFEDLEPELARRGIPTYAGSNAWVVAPKKSATGRALLYGGPMMGFNCPSVCNEIHLVAPGFDTFGMSFLGVPGVLIGFTRRHAWTTTSGGADLVDIFALELNPDDPNEYKTAAGWKKFERIVHTIPVRGGAPAEFVVERSDLGPIVDRDRKTAYAAKMSYWGREQETVSAFIAFDRVQTLDEFQKNAARVVTSHNIFYADVDGRIAFWYAGRFPRRKKGHDPRFVQPPEMDWDGVLDFSEWPKSIDPPCGFFGNWNNKPSRAWEPTEWGKIFHGKRILDRLEAIPRLSFEDMEQIAFETANHEFLADYFLPFFLDAAKGREEIKIFDGWDHREDGGPRSALLHAWLDAVIDDVFADEVLPLVKDKGSRRFLINPLLYMLEGDRCHYAMRHDFMNGRPWRDVVVKGLDAALAELRKKESDPAKWTYDENRRVNFGDLVSVASARDRGTYQMTVELSPELRAETLCAPGQSEDPASPHYRDQIENFTAWRYKRISFVPPPGAAMETIDVRR